jgi:hypothetical protein
MGMFHNEDEEEEDLAWWDEEEEIWEDDEDGDAAFWEDHEDDGIDEDGLDDDISEASTLEPQEEADACDQASEITRNRHLLHPPNGYMLPSFTFHFQSADAVAVSADPFCPGANLIATMESDGVLLFRMPAVGEMTQIGGPPQVMKYLGGFESPSLSAYSMEISPNGRYLLAGGDEGSLEIYSIDSRAPQRPPVPKTVVDDMSEEQPFFYLPIIPPESDWVTGNRPDHVAREVHELLSAPEVDEMQAHGNIYHSYPRTRNDAVFLNVLGFRDAAFLTAHSAHAAAGVPPVQRPDGAEIMKRSPLGWVPRDVFFAAAVDDQYRGLEQQFNGFTDILGGKEKIDWRIEEEDERLEVEGNEQEQRRQRMDLNNKQKGAITLAGTLVLGFSTQTEAYENTTNLDGMVNGVRFGIVGGKERILAADQSGRVYIFEIPPDDCHVRDVVAAMMCTELVTYDRANNPSSKPPPADARIKLMPVVGFAASPNALGANLDRRACVLQTAALGPYGVPLNLAAASPDGKWIALVGDQQKVILLDQMDNYSSRELSFEPRRFDYDFLDPENVEVGSQYCAWNASSTLLAVTSDALHAVFVFGIPSGQLVMRVEGFVRTVLPVMFAPWNDRIIIFGEETKMVHVRVVEPEGTVDFNAREDLAEPGLTSQLIRVPADPRRPRGGRRRITGMATTRQGDVLISTKQGIMYRYLPANGWVPENTSDWPVRFRESAQSLLKCAARQGGGRGVGPGGLTALPPPVVQHIIKSLAGKKTDWLDVLPDPVAETQEQQQEPEEQPPAVEVEQQPAAE